MGVTATADTPKDVASICEVCHSYGVELAVLMVGVFLEREELASLTNGLTHGLAVGGRVHLEG